MSQTAYTVQEQSRAMATETIGLQSLKYLLSGLLQKKFANPCPDACHMPICLQMSHLAKTAQSRVPGQINTLRYLKYRNGNY